MTTACHRDLVGKLLGGKYQVVRLIGTGGMATVYEVEHRVTQRRGALKLLHDEYARMERVVVRFTREASAAGRIGSPHIVETYDAGELPDGEPYIFMELLHGESLRTRLDHRTRLPFDEARVLIGQAAQGLAHAHKAGIIHRDIKPDNLFICSGDAPFVKILDFGISKFADHGADLRLTGDSETIGTPLYMAPEQVRGGNRMDARCDVYALGIVLYECVTGCVPFTADTLAALAVRILAGEARPPCALVPDLPPDLDGFIDQAMAVDPRERFASMDAFLNALASIATAAPLPPSAGLPPPVEDRIRPRPGSKALLLGALLLGCMSSIFAFWRWSTVVPPADPHVGPALESTASVPSVQPPMAPPASSGQDRAPSPLHDTDDTSSAIEPHAPEPPATTPSEQPRPRRTESPAEHHGLSIDNPFLPPKSRKRR